MFISVSGHNHFVHVQEVQRLIKILQKDPVKTVTWKIIFGNPSPLLKLTIILQKPDELGSCKIQQIKNPMS